MTLKEALYEAPGPRTRRNIRIATAFSVIFIGFDTVILTEAYSCTAKKIMCDILKS